MTPPDDLAAEAPEPDSVSLARALRGFVAERLARLSGGEGDDDPRVTARLVGDLTRCLKELVALERLLAVEARARDGSGENADAAMDARTAHVLAERVAHEIEASREPGGNGNDLGGLFGERAPIGGGEPG